MSLSRLSKMLFTIMVSTGFITAKTVRVPNDYSNLQLAVNGANAGDTIVITVDTPGAIVNKQLTIQGTGGAAVSAATSATFEGSTFGIGLTCTGPSSTSTCASGTLIRNVTIDVTSYSPRPDLGVVSGGASSALGFGSAAKDVTVRQCTIVETYQGISGRCANVTGLPGACPTGWTVAQNDITLNSGPTTTTGAYIGIVPYNGADNWSIVHNDVTRPDVAAPAISNCFSGIAGIQVLASSDPAYVGSPATITASAVKQNKVAVKGQCVNPIIGCANVSFPSCGEPVVVDADSGAPPASNDLTTVAYNDLRDSNFNTLVYSMADPSITSPGASCLGAASNDLTGLHQYTWPFIFGTGSVTCLTSLGNMDDFGNGNRGSTSGSFIRPGRVLPK